MKNAAKILDSELEKLSPNGFIKMFYKINRSKILDIIKTIQNDAYNQAIDDAAENAQYGISQNDDSQEPWIHESNIFIDRDSILILKRNNES